MINLGVIVLELGMCYSKVGEIHPPILLRVTKMNILLEGLKYLFFVSHTRTPICAILLNYFYVKLHFYVLFPLVKAILGKKIIYFSIWSFYDAISVFLSILYVA